MRLTFRILAAIAAPVIVAGVACSASSGSGALDQGFNGGSSGGGAAGSPFGGNPFGGSSLGGGSSAGDPGFGGQGFGGFGTPVGGDGGNCDAKTFTGERLPLDIYFLVDKSGSMDQNNKWQSVSSSLVAFLNDPANADIGAGIGYFPLTIPGINPFCTVDADCASYGPCVGGVDIGGGSHLFGNCQGADVCQVSSYAAPAVPLSLPPNHPPVVSSIQGTSPGGGTPTRPALEGTMQYVVGWAQQNPGRKTVVVLATDGDPTGCTTNAVQDSANIAAQALSQNGIQTFVIGVGNSLTSLNQIAQAGGTGQAYIVDAGGNVQQQFSDALAAIHGAALPCSFSIPTDGQADPNKVNITFTANGDPAAQTVPRTSSADSSTCPTNAPAWYYSDAAKTSAVLCDATCANLKTISATVSFALGCTTQVAPPPH
jgi:hypothetical protein